MKAWLEADEDDAAEIVRLFNENGAFEEYNSPTYYGIDLYALALWRLHPPTERFRVWGEQLNADLWHDIARWYHPDGRLALAQISPFLPGFLPCRARRPGNSWIQGTKDAGPGPVSAATWPGLVAAKHPQRRLT